MTYLQRIETHLASRPGLCDDCLARELRIRSRQQVRSICTKSRNIQGANETCCGCAKVKIVRSLAASPPLSSRCTIKSKKKKTANYVRESDLREKLNGAVVSALGIPEEDYYNDLNFDRLLLLKGGLARIHDIITLKLTLALVDWAVQRFKLGPVAREELRGRVNGTHPNTSGFDLICEDPNLIGEVKSCIPVNEGETFGAAQINGLTNDVRQMLGHPARGKQKKKLTKNTKVNRDKRDEAIKILGLYDSSEVRAATTKWRANLLKSKTWKSLHSFTILDLPEAGELSPHAVYLVYLTPSGRLAGKEEE